MHDATNSGAPVPANENKGDHLDTISVPRPASSGQDAHDTEATR
jgi:hypothetical protein